VHRAAWSTRRAIEEPRRFEASKRRYQDKFCGARLQGLKSDYRPHCRGDACPSFAPVSLISTGPNVLVVNPNKTEAKTLNDVIAMSKAGGGKVSFGSSGPGSVAQLAGEMFKIQAKLDLIHVAYKGGILSVNDLVGGQIDGVLGCPAGHAEHPRRKLRAICQTGPTRSSLVGDVPTCAESGMPGLVIENWRGVFFRRDAEADPRQVPRRPRQGHAAPETKEGFGKLGVEAVYSIAEQLAAHVRAESEVREAHQRSQHQGAVMSELFSCAPAGPALARTAKRSVAKRVRSLVVDLHCHCKTAAVEPLAAPHYALEREPMDRFSNDRTREVNRQQGARIAPQLSSVEQRIKDMDRMGVDVQAVSTSPLQFHYWTPPTLAPDHAPGEREHRGHDRAPSASSASRARADAGRADGGRRAGALREGARVRGADRHEHRGRQISDSRFEPFWEGGRAGRGGLIHPTASPTGAGSPITTSAT
jgi:hypothetical protein